MELYIRFYVFAFVDKSKIGEMKLRYMGKKSMNIQMNR